MHYDLISLIVIKKQPSFKESSPQQLGRLVNNLAPS
jgi:hypothetical protein